MSWFIDMSMGVAALSVAAFAGSLAYVVVREIVNEKRNVGR